MVTLKNFIAKTSTGIVETIWEDFMSLDPADSRFKDVEFILVDPSCTGSGMMSITFYFYLCYQTQSFSKPQRMAVFLMMDIF